MQLSRLLEDEDESRRPRNANVLGQKENKAWLNDIRQGKGLWAGTLGENISKVYYNMQHRDIILLYHIIIYDKT